MKGTSLRLILDPLLGIAICATAMQYPLASTSAARSTAIVEQFEARAVGVAGTEDTGRIGIYIERWSTDEELTALRAAVAQSDPEKVLEVLRQQRRAGVILMPGVQAHGDRARTRTPRNVLFAYQVATQTGRHVILGCSEHLGFGESQIDARKSIREFNLVDLRIAAHGTGVAKVATAADVVVSPAGKTLEMRDYEARPARLVDVKVGQAGRAVTPRPQRLF